MKKDTFDPVTIGAKIKEIRLKAGSQQLEVAKILGFQSATALSLVESGQRSISLENLTKLAKHFHLSLDHFLGTQPTQKTDVLYALRADKSLGDDDKESIKRFIELARSKYGKGGRKDTR